MKIKISLSEAQMGELFHFMGMEFDPWAATQAIKAGKLKVKAEEIDISQWAKQVLALKLGDTDHKPHAFLMRINYKHLDTITEERMKQPLLLVDTKHGSIVIDGNHRIAKAYMEGKTKLPAYIIDEKSAKKFRIRIR